MSQRKSPGNTTGTAVIFLIKQDRFSSPEPFSFTFHHFLFGMKDWWPVEGSHICNQGNRGHILRRIDQKVIESLILPWLPWAAMPGLLDWFALDDLPDLCKPQNTPWLIHHGWVCYLCMKALLTDWLLFPFLWTGRLILQKEPLELDTPGFKFQICLLLDVWS